MDAPPTDAAGRLFWEQTWAGHQPQSYPGPTVFDFHELYQRFLPRSEALTCIEIGAMPGNHLVYFRKEYQYRVTALDYCSDLSPLINTFAVNGIDEYSLINVDLFSIADEERYDVVFSSGFVEHFDDYERVMAAHVKMLKEHGHLLVTVPNTRYIHAALMRLFCPRILATHRTYLMDPNVLRQVTEGLGCDVLFCGYLRTFRPFYPLPSWMGLLARAIGRCLRVLRLDRVSNEFASPYLYLVARKRGGGAHLPRSGAVNASYVTP